jgi:hypothetical protein
MFPHMVEKLLNIEYFFIDNSFKSKQKICMGILDIVGKPSSSIK